MKKMLLTAAVAAMGVCLDATADVTTNVWINPEGGYWADPANWQDGNVAKSDTVADFRQLASGFTVTITNYTYSGGMVFAGGTDDVWTLTSDSDTRLCPRTDLFGYMPICVEGGTLSLDLRMKFEGNHRVRKEGSGTLKTFREFPYDPFVPDNQVIVADGRLRPTGSTDFWQANIHVTGTGALDVPDSFNGLWLGSYSSDNSATFDMKGRRFLFGASRGAELSGNVLGTGQVVSVAGQVLAVSEARPGVEYVAREGAVQFGEMATVGYWAFDDPANPGKDSSLLANDLAVSNSVTVVDDAERGKVALFDTDSCLVGTGPGRSIRNMPTGNASYTVAVWVKANAAVTPGDAALFYWGPLPVQSYSGLLSKILKRNGTDNAGAYAGHGSSGFWWRESDSDSVGFYDGEWHHFAVSYDGATRTLSLYHDAICAGTLDYKEQVNNSQAENFAIGLSWSQYGKYPKGIRLDDAVFLNRCLSADEVTALKDGTFATVPQTMPAGVKLSTTYNGEIHLAGDQVVSEIGGDAVRGGVVMPVGGTLTVTGAVEKGVSRYAADIAGDTSLVKDGADTTLRLTGPLSYTGSTRVKAGTLAVGDSVSAAAPFAAYDFEDSDLGLDSSGNGYNLAVNGATRVWDDERGGWVARFSAAGKNDLNGNVNSTSEMVGDSDYTLSVWAKPSASCPSQGSFLSFGTSGNFHQIQFRFQDFSQRTLVLAHWGGTFDFTGIPSTSASPAGEWHHYVAVREGTAFRVYVDGVQTWSTTKSGALDFLATRKLHIGSFFGDNDARFFDGDMDDVCVFGRALDEADVRRLYARVTPQAAALPTPVLHYAFEDEENPGKDSSGSGCDLTVTGTVTCEASPLGGKALTFNTSAVSYLSASLPSAIPAAGAPMTLTFWVQGGAKDANESATYPTFVSWGDPNAKTIDFMSAYRYDLPWRPRLYVKKSDGNALDLGANKDFLMYPSASDNLRWHHFAIVYDPASGVTTYVDGQAVATLSQAGAFTNVRTAGGAFFLGVKPNNLTHPFKGRLDEVKVYATALTKAQVRRVLRAEQGQGTRVLPADTDMTVDAGARLAVDYGEQAVASLTGGGNVAIATNASLMVSAVSGFTGMVTGAGTFGLADGAVLDFGNGASPVIETEGTVVLGANVRVDTSFESGMATLMRAAAFEGVENLSSWTDSSRVRFVVSSDGKALQMVVGGGTLMIFR